MNLAELMALLRKEHLVAEGIWQDERIEALIVAYGHTCVINAIAAVHQQQALADSQARLASVKRVEPLPFDDEGAIDIEDTPDA